ncbi:flap endonuclease-1 [Candidatus Woesearchaeota archaeon]|nr:MAG: flap endonuclease-1 [Candidatus Woesearchaeota archaeon]
MGTNITPLLTPTPITLEELAGKQLAIDAHNIIYQFLTTIRMRDGTPLRDSKGNITSHLIGLFNRTATLIEKNILPVFVFDGKPPELKQEEIRRRRALKEAAAAAFEEAKASEDVEAMAKYAGRTTKLTPDLISEAKKLLSSMGVPSIDAPSEGEAQAAYLVKNGDAYAVVSQDADALLFGAPRLIKNLNIAGKRKQVGKHIYQTTHPELVTLTQTLNHLQITQDQLIALGILVGTDYCPGGAKGIGPKKALALLRKHGTNFEAAFKEAKWEEQTNIPWKEIFKLFKQPAITTQYTIKREKPNPVRIRNLLVQEHDFSPERVEHTIKKLENSRILNQKGLADYF